MKKFCFVIIGVLLLVAVVPSPMHISQAQAAGTCGNGNNTLVDATGSVLPGRTGTVSAWTNVAHCSNLIVSAKNKASSPSAQTFSFQEVVCGFSSCSTYSLGSVTVLPGQIKYLNLSIVPGGLSEALNSYVSAASSTSTSPDNFHVVVGNVQFPGI